jgi:hypothetical protein
MRRADRKRKGGVVSQSNYEQSSTPPDPWLTRRAFLRASAVTVAGLAFPATAVAGGRRISEVEAFLALSRLVTGSNQLSRQLAPRYLEALNESPLAMSPSRFTRLAGFADGRGPATLAGLQQAPAFRMKGGAKTVEAVAAAWWSGMVPTAEGGQRVITYHDALVWRALPYAQAPSLCLGAPGSWAKPGKGAS